MKCLGLILIFIIVFINRKFHINKYFMIRTITIYYRSFSRAHMLVPESVQFAFEKSK